MNIEEALVSALVDALRFLEFSSDEEVNPDSAVRCMENIASNLLKLDIEKQVALRAIFLRLSELPEEDDPEFVSGIPDMAGLANLPYE